MTLIARPARSYEQMPYLPDTQFDRLYEPKTGAVVDAMVSDAFNGVGTANADSVANSIEAANKTGKRIDLETYKNSPSYRTDFPHYAELTEEGAALAAKNIDQSRARQELIAKASGAQYALGLGASLILGTAEQKNLIAGLATSLVGMPMLGAIAPKAGRVRNLLNARRANATYSAKAGLGATEGLVAAAITEPSNRYSASILQEDYTMMDSLFNVATSTLLGAGLEVAPSYIRNKWNDTPNKVRAMDVITTEHDLAVEQLATGRKIEVGAVEKAYTGEISKKPVAEQIRANKIDLTSDKYFDDTALGNAKNQNSKSRDILVYLTPDEFLSIAKSGIDKTKAERVKSIGDAGQKFSDIPQISFENDGNGFAYVTGHEGRHRAMYLKEKGVANIPVVMRSTTLNAVDRPTIRWGELGTKSPDDFIAQGWTFPTKIRQQDGENIVDFPINIDDIANNSRRLDTENAKAIGNHVKQQLDPNNDTAIDTMAISRLEDYEETLMVQKHIDELEKTNAYVDELNKMEAEGIISSKELDDLMDAMEAVDVDKLQSAWEAARICLTRG
jgi:hypothetical protein